MLERAKLRGGLLIAILMVILSGNNLYSAEILGLGDLPGGTDGIDMGFLAGPIHSRASGISADGSIIVGKSNGVNGFEAFYWSTDRGLIGIGDLTGGIFESHAVAVSTDGSVIVGTGHTAIGPEAFRWTQADGMVGLGFLRYDLMNASVAKDVSADGSVIVGYSAIATSNPYTVLPPQEAFIWTEADGMVGLGGLSIGANSVARGVSADGSVVVGSSSTPDPGGAFIWTQSGGMVNLGALPDFDDTIAMGISADGLVAIGIGFGDTGHVAFRWTEVDGMESLGFLPDGDLSWAWAVSGDGSVVVGYSSSSRGIESYRWTSENGMESISELLSAEGIDLTGWELSEATAVSDDGSVIAGTGTNPNGYIEAWLARLNSGLITPTVINESVNSLLPITESSHSLTSEILTTHLQSVRQFKGRPGATFDLYSAGFGGEWNSYTAGGTVGLAMNASDVIRIGGGVFASQYKDDELSYSGQYELNAIGGTLWAGYADPERGAQLHVVGMLADLDSDIERGYLNGSGLDSSKGKPGGSLTGLSIYSGWKVPISYQASITPFAIYNWTRVKLDGYAETGGGFPAIFDRRQDNAEIIKAGFEGEYGLTEDITTWGQVAYGNRLDDKSTGISGNIVGLMDFAQAGYKLDDDWIEMDIGVKWQSTESLSVMLTGGSAFGSDQNPAWMRIPTKLVQ